MDTPLAAFIDEVRASQKFVAGLARKPSLAIAIADMETFLRWLDAGSDGAHGVALREELERIASAVIAPSLAAKGRVN